MAVAQLPPRWGTRTLPAVLRELLSDGASPVRGLHPSTCQRRGTSYVVLGERRECPEPSAKPVSFPLFARGGFEASSTQRGSSRRELAVPGGDARTSAVGRAQGHCHGQGRGATAPPAPQSQPVTPQHQPVLRRTQPAPPRASLCSPEPSLCSPQRPACALPRAQPAPPPQHPACALPSAQPSLAGRHQPRRCPAPRSPVGAGGSRCLRARREPPSDSGGGIAAGGQDPGVPPPKAVGSPPQEPRPPAAGHGPGCPTAGLLRGQPSRRTNHPGQAERGRARTLIS